ncbi:MAG TPA: AMP-binding protein, partial [Ottowia sp.]|nr:AMP-binding protein [Ottowia sp.]HPP98808.1 AMP-binding protein [Ottowia sp.]
AMLLHRNLIANVLQSEAWNDPVMKSIPAGEQPTSVCALPLYHIFAFTVNMMLSMRTGGKTILIPNPRDLPATLKELSKHTFHSFPAVNTLFNGLANHPDFNTVNWKNLRASVGGGMAVQSAVAKLWLEKTGCPIVEGYGLSETSPSASCNPVTLKEFTGTIGLPLPSTYLKILDDNGVEVPLGQPGEIAIKGPQVMAGYWQRPDETAKVMTPDGYFKSGDIGIMDERGYTRIVDRKKDMILVSGFNVYPNEIEDVVAAIPGVLEVGAVGVPDEKMGEAIKLVIVKKDPGLTEEAVRAYCKQNLTGYKQPRVIEFRAELPKTPVGKVLRRELRDPAPAKPAAASVD